MNRTVVAMVVAVVVIGSIPWTVPLLTRGVESFKTFLELRTLLNPCDGAGSPPPCR